MLRVRLKEAMDDYRQRTGERMTHDLLSQRTGLSRSTIESLASRQSYNTRLSTIYKICIVLGCQPGDILFLDIEDLDDKD